MPSRRRPKQPKVEPRDPVEQFATMLRESAERDQAARDRAQREQEQARAAAQAAADHAAAVDTAHRELALAITAAREARRIGTGVAAADAAWREAKARVIELETGTRPEWAPGEPADDPGVSGTPSGPDALE